MTPSIRLSSSFENFLRVRGKGKGTKWPFVRLIVQFYPSFETVLVFVHQGRFAYLQFFCASCNPVTAVMRTYIHAVACILHISVRSDGNSIAREEEGIIDLLEYIPSLGAGCNRRLDVTGLTVPSAIWRTVNGKRPAGCNVISKPKFVSNYWRWWLLQISRNSWWEKSIALSETSC